MAEDDEGGRRGQDDLPAYDVGRLLALSDGVFAIAMTLLVLGIPVPHLAQQATATDSELLGVLEGIAGNVGTFALSFVLVGV